MSIEENKNENRLKKFYQFRRLIVAYKYVLTLASWDTSTIAPRGAMDNRAEQLNVIIEELYKIRTSAEYYDVITKLYNDKEQFSEIAHELELLVEDANEIKKIPMDELLAYQKLISKAQIAWIDAKNNNDFNSFAPYLEKIVTFKRKEAKWLETDKLKGYDVLLNQYEKGYTQKEYDVFFDLLKKELIPFVKEILNKKIVFDNRLKNISVSLEKQKKIIKLMMEILCFDTNHGLVGESEHPFSCDNSSSDVRFTIHYYQNHFEYALFSAIHELGHSIYSQQVDRQYQATLMDGGASMAIHESQSRFYENIIARSEDFCQQNFSKIQKIIGKKLQGVTWQDFYKFVNNVEASYIRTEADELTYPLHIMLRYDLEKKLINGELEVKDLEKQWNLLFKEYFGLDVPASSLGVLQDIHWSDGSFGYFPTYALGSAIASQVFAKMNDDLNIKEILFSKNTKLINDWLKEKIHRHGNSKYSKDLLFDAVGEKFDACYYLNYLKSKYSKLYDLKNE